MMKLGNKEPSGISFNEVFSAEIEEIELVRRKRIDPDYKSSPEQDINKKADEMRLIGLAFSGGGIRSATFNLGVLQALAELDMLRFFDYLSTVSGGGYIGSWLTTWISREGSINSVQEKLSKRTKIGSRAEEYRPVFFLRQYSNYLTPKTGLFSVDLWTAISTYLRNLSLNFGVLFPLFLCILLLPMLLVSVFSASLFQSRIDSFRLFIEAALSLGIGGFFISANLMYQPQPGGKAPWYATGKSIAIFIIFPVLLSAFLGSLWLWFYHDSIKDSWIGYFVLVSVLYLFFWLLGWVNAQIYAAKYSKEIKSKIISWLKETSVKTFMAVRKVGEELKNIPKQPNLEIGACIFSMLLSGVLWAILLVGSWKLLGFFKSDDMYAVWYVIALGMPLLLVVYMSVITLQIGLMGRSAAEGVREWWSRLGGFLLIIILGWLGLFGIVIAGPPVLVWGKQLSISLIGSGWVASTIAGLLLGKSPKTGKEGTNKWLELLAKVSPYVFIAGLLLFCSSILSAICITMADFWPEYWDALWHSQGTLSISGLFMINTYFMTSVDHYTFLLAFLLCAAVLLLLSSRVDINIFSMHLLYRNRLVRCFLGASNKARTPHPFYGFDPNDDVSVHDFLSSRKYVGPYPIINTTLNLVGGRELAWQQRKAASFVFTPKFSGFEIIKADKVQDSKGIRFINVIKGGYRSTETYANDEGVMLGEAMAISGAAASPNMGYHSSRPLAFLMTIFNIRLGWWVGNPRYSTWEEGGTPWGIWYLFAELFGLTRDNSKYVYLSDGGHFENLGVYELVRRKCKVIIVSDAGCDPNYAFDDLGNAIRKIRVDFGIKINIDLEHLKKDAKRKMHCAIGTIYYEDGKGILIYFKPILCGGEPVDVMNYKTAHEDFPHQSTADQWFDEAQFEAYRMLGYHSVKRIIDDEWTVASVDNFINQVSRYRDEIMLGVNSEKPIF